jgi:hypothetical protein
MAGEEYRRQKAEDRSKKQEVRSKKQEARRQKTEDHAPTQFVFFLLLTNASWPF